MIIRVLRMNLLKLQIRNCKLYISALVNCKLYISALVFRSIHHVSVTFFLRARLNGHLSILTGFHGKFFKNCLILLFFFFLFLSELRMLRDALS